MPTPIFLTDASEGAKKREAEEDERRATRNAKNKEDAVKKAEAEFEKASAKEIEAFDRDYEASVKVEECLSQINEILRNSGPIDISKYLDSLNKVKEKHDQAGKELLMAKKECEKANKKRIKVKQGLEKAEHELWSEFQAVTDAPRIDAVEESKTK